MSWKAGYASEVIRTLDKQWADIFNNFSGRLNFIPDVKNIKLESGDENPAITTPNGSRTTFDIVIIAIGFGLDNYKPSFGYWADVPWDNVQFDAASGTFFVSGAGDGALTDLMRLCFLDFKHGDALTAVDAATRETVAKELCQAEQEINSVNKTKAGEGLLPHYLKAAARIADALDGAPDLKPRQLNQVWLNCPPGYLFGRTSSILNRLITAYLLHRKRFKLIDGYLDTIEAKDDRFNVIFKNNTHDPITVDHVIIRHGPDKPLGPDGIPRTWKSFEAIWDSTKQLRSEWSEIRQHHDWTREPIYSSGDFDLSQSHTAALKIDFGNDVGCVLITGPSDPPGLSQGHRVQNALKLFAKQLGGKLSGRSLQTTPEVINSEAALASSAAYEKTIRALCHAEIAVFDVTKFDRIVMLFLGIRAAVRRGITVTVTQDDFDSKSLPFNLAALNPIRLDNKNDVSCMVEAFAEGLSTLEARADYYLDLPVYDAVRRLGKNFTPLEPSEQILILRWFDEQYANLVTQLIETPLLEGFEPPNGEIKVVTTLDSSSPQLVDQRLYAAIRRSNLCIADWTGWRANVFFEVGVRLAVNEFDPVFIYCKAKPPGWDDTESQWPVDPLEAPTLLKFFDPITFDFSNADGLLEFIKEMSDSWGDDNGGGAPRRPHAKLSPGRTYKIVLESIDRRNEPGGRSVFDLLLMEAEMLAGPAVSEEGDLPVLYGEVLDVQVRRRAAEYLIILWYSEDNRYKLTKRIADGTIASDPESQNRLERLQRVGEQLRDRLRNAPEFSRERDDIDCAMKLIEQYLECKHG
jgi:hypothetical protein